MRKSRFTEERIIKVLKEHTCGLSALTSIAKRLGGNIVLEDVAH